MVFEKKDRIGYLTLTVAASNAMNYQGALDLNRAAEMIRNEPDVRLVLVSSAERSVRAST
jgi:enoyl-CoA hydratase/carnithine racemase